MDLEAEFDALARSVRNWGRWGPEDRRGTLNLITPDVLVDAAATVRQGKVFSLGLPLSSEGPQFGANPVVRKSPHLAARFNPHLYVTALSMRFGTSPRAFAFSDDVVVMPMQCATQWDALSHVEYDGRFYNDSPTGEAMSISGATDHSIAHLATPGITSRGVLLDIARLHGVDRLSTEHEISVDELEAAEARQGVQVRPGDILLVRTGHIRLFVEEGDRPAFKGRQPGLSWRAAPWLHERGVAAVAADNLAVEPLPGPDPNVVALPLHMLCLVDMGLTFGEMFDLEALAEDCAEDGEYAFLLSAPALKIVTGVGSTINPLVLK